jgi:hypothetical protein
MHPRGNHKVQNTRRTSLIASTAHRVPQIKDAAGDRCTAGFRPGGVAYLALEGIGGLPSRLTAIARRRGCTQALPFVYRPDCPALTAPDALDKLTTMVEGAAKALRDRFDVETVLVFIDTVVTAAGYAKAGDDNDTAIAERIMSVLHFGGRVVPGQ